MEHERGPRTGERDPARKGGGYEPGDLDLVKHEFGYARKEARGRDQELNGRTQESKEHDGFDASEAVLVPAGLAAARRGVAGLGCPGFPRPPTEPPPLGSAIHGWHVPPPPPLLRQRSIPLHTQSISVVPQDSPWPEMHVTHVPPRSPPPVHTSPVSHMQGFAIA
jgi:hypothetical protein